MTTTPKSKSLYGKWLSLIVDQEKAGVADILSFMSEFDSRKCKAHEDYQRYAHLWGMLSAFLWKYRTQQLYSTRTNMLFRLDDFSIDIYWFEVLRSTLLLSASTLETIARVLRTMEIDKDTQYTEITLHRSGKSITISKYNEVLQMIKSNIGVCHYTMMTATERCIYLYKYAPIQITHIKRVYYSLRIIGAWIAARISMLNLEYNGAVNLFATAEYLGMSNDTFVDDAACFVQSAPCMMNLCQIEKAMLLNFPGVAIALARDSPTTHPSDERCIQTLAQTINSKGAFAPPKNDNLLQRWTKVEYIADLLTYGDAIPFHHSPFYRFQPKADNQ
jgi:hypothetical protein